MTRRWLIPALAATVLIVGLAAGAAAAIETDSVESYWAGLWWSISLVTTVGFIGEPPHTAAGAILSVALMVGGFLLLAMVSASLAALFVSDEERPRELREASVEQAILTALAGLDSRLTAIEARMRPAIDEQVGRPADPQSDARTQGEPGESGDHAPGARTRTDPAG